MSDIFFAVAHNPSDVQQNELTLKASTFFLHSLELQYLLFLCHLGAEGKKKQHVKLTSTMVNWCK